MTVPAGVYRFKGDLGWVFWYKESRGTAVIASEGDMCLVINVSGPGRSSDDLLVMIDGQVLCTGPCPQFLSLWERIL